MDFDIHLFTVLKTIAFLAIVYFCFGALAFIIKGLALPVHRKAQIRNWKKTLKTIFVPLAILIVLVSLVLWKKQEIGIPVLISSILFFRPLVNFFHGLIVKGKPDLALGTDISIGDLEGRLNQWGYTEMKLSTKDGIISIPYSHIFDKGYSVLIESNKAQVVELNIVGDLENKDKVVDRLVSSPFLKLNSIVNIDSLSNVEMAVLTFVPRSIEYLRDIQSIITDSGFTIQSK